LSLAFLDSATSPELAWLRGLLALAYTYGFRRGDLLGEWEKGQWKRMPMLCNQVDLLNDTASLYSGETKNGEGRIVALTEECRLLVTELRKGKQPEDFLFMQQRGACPRLSRNVGRAHQSCRIARIAIP